MVDVKDAYRKMGIRTAIIILINIVAQVNTAQLYSIFHQDIAKRFDRVKDLHTEKILYSNIRNKVKKDFENNIGKDSDAKMGYFIHVVPLPTRRMFQFNQYEGESVIGVPSNKWHLPAAELLLPGHTLSRPSLGMLKSAVTFPHSENGATVYGNSDNLGIRYGVRSGRILYSQNRRMLPDSSWVDQNSTDSTLRPSKPEFYLVPISLNSVRDKESKNLIKNILQKLRSHRDTYPNSGHVPVNSKTRATVRPLKSSKSKKDVNMLKTYMRNKSGYTDARIEEMIRRTIKKTTGEIESRQFWNSKNMFDHVKFALNKPEMKDLFPADPNKVKRNWWYFNEDDLSQLTAALRKTMRENNAAVYV